MLTLKKCNHKLFCVTLIHLVSFSLYVPLTKRNNKNLFSFVLILYISYFRDFGVVTTEEGMLNSVTRHASCILERLFFFGIKRLLLYLHLSKFRNPMHRVIRFVTSRVISQGF